MPLCVYYSICGNAGHVYPNGNQSAYCTTCMSLKNNVDALIAYYNSRPRRVKQSRCTVAGCNDEAVVAGFCSSCQWN